MNGGILALMIAGLVSFLVGGYLAATGERSIGIALMGMGLIFQVLTLRQLKMIKKDQDDAG
ncbi:hypothetical protein [uncultured Erythrobacter sp.]|uniref:hypothetical protein n=1 Tax=uncultured Erythrobacter sp. TaxID=263913 RepID=UPI0026143278|nr:hypothetical protein [uncultured Erythrobacter sp.]